MTQGKSMGRVLDEVVALDPDRTALVVGGVATSYAALEGCDQRCRGGTGSRRGGARLAHPAGR